MSLYTLRILTLTLFIPSLPLTLTGCGETRLTNKPQQSQDLNEPGVGPQEGGEQANIPRIAKANSSEDLDTSRFNPLAFGRAHGALQHVMDQVVVDAPEVSPQHTGFSQVNYDVLQKNKDVSQKLNEYWSFILDQELALYLVQDDPRLSADFQWAFWVNYYNACILLFLSDTDNLARAKSYINGLNDERFVSESKTLWEQKICPSPTENLSLNEVEHGILRNRDYHFFNPRTHYLVNCASSSCPKLSRQIFSSQNIQELSRRLEREHWLEGRNAKNGFERQARLDGDVIYVNPIFIDWFPDDFENFQLDGQSFKTLSDYLQFILAGAEGENSNILQTLKNRGQRSLSAFDYDWTLNHTEIVPNDEASTYQEKIPYLNSSKTETSYLLFEQKGDY